MHTFCNFFFYQFIRRASGMTWQFEQGLPIMITYCFSLEEYYVRIKNYRKSNLAKTLSRKGSSTYYQLKSLNSLAWNSWPPKSKLDAAVKNARESRRKCKTCQTNKVAPVKILDMTLYASLLQLSIISLTSKHNWNKTRTIVWTALPQFGQSVYPKLSVLLRQN